MKYLKCSFVLAVLLSLFHQLCLVSGEPLPFFMSVLNKVRTAIYGPQEVHGPDLPDHLPLQEIERSVDTLNIVKKIEDNAGADPQVDQDLAGRFIFRNPFKGNDVSFHNGFYGHSLYSKLEYALQILANIDRDTDNLSEINDNLSRIRQEISSCGRAIDSVTGSVDSLTNSINVMIGDLNAIAVG